MHNFGKKKLNQSKLNEQFSRNKYTTISTEKRNQLRILEAIKKLVDWCDEIYTYMCIKLCLQFLYGK